MMEKTGSYTFDDGDEVRTIECGRLDDGRAYVRETGRGSVTRFAYGAPARESVVRFTETRDYTLDDVERVLREHGEETFLVDIEQILEMWGIAYDKEEKTSE